MDETTILINTTIIVIISSTTSTKENIINITNESNAVSMLTVKEYKDRSSSSEIFVETILII